MGERRDRRDPQAGAAGPGGVRREPAGPHAHGFLPGPRPPGAGHPADGGVLWRRPARRGNGAAHPGADRPARAQPGRGPGSADAGHPAVAGVPGPYPERAPRPADGGAAAAQRPARRPRRETALGNQPVRPRPVRRQAAAAPRRPGAPAHLRAADAAAQAAADAAGGAGRGDPQPGPADQPGLHGAGLRPPRIAVQGGPAGPPVDHRLGHGRGPGQRQHRQRHHGAQPAAPGRPRVQAPGRGGRRRDEPGGARRTGEEPAVLCGQGVRPVAQGARGQGRVPSRRGAARRRRGGRGARPPGRPGPRRHALGGRRPVRGTGAGQGQPRPLRAQRPLLGGGPPGPGDAAQADRRHPGGARLRPAAPGDPRPARSGRRPGRPAPRAQRRHPDGRRRCAALRRGHPGRYGRAQRGTWRRGEPPADHRRGADPPGGDQGGAQRPGAGQGRHHRVHRLAVEPRAPGAGAGTADPGPRWPGNDRPGARGPTAGGLQPLHPGTAAGAPGGAGLAQPGHPGRRHHRRRVLPRTPLRGPGQLRRADPRRRRGEPGAAGLSAQAAAFHPRHADARRPGGRGAGGNRPAGDQRRRRRAGGTGRRRRAAGAGRHSARGRPGLRRRARLGTGQCRRSRPARRRVGLGPAGHRGSGADPRGRRGAVAGLRRQLDPRRARDTGARRCRRRLQPGRAAGIARRAGGAELVAGREPVPGRPGAAARLRSGARSPGPGGRGRFLDPRRPAGPGCRREPRSRGRRNPLDAGRRNPLHLRHLVEPGRPAGPGCRGRAANQPVGAGQRTRMGPGVRRAATWR